LPHHKQLSNHFEHFPQKKELAMQNYEIPHQYPIYPFPEGWVSGPSRPAGFEGEFLVPFAGGIDVSNSSKKLFAFFPIISIIPI
jgi:hypothetical protein